MGEMWFATKDGAVRYDSKRLYSYKYDPKNKKSIGGNFVERIFVGKDNSIWVGTQPVSLCKYNSKLDFFERIPGIQGNRVKGINKIKRVYIGLLLILRCIVITILQKNYNLFCFKKNQLV